MKQLLSLLSLIAGLSFFICSFLAEPQPQSLLLMALAVVFLLLTIGMLSFEGSTTYIRKKELKKIFNQ